ncbi:D-cysteine desulfhydrase, partial [Dysosmobacter welbionis]
LTKLALDLLLQVGRDDLQLPVMLEQLPGDVQGQVGRVHHPPDEAEVLRQQVGALVHDEDAIGVQLQPFLILLGVVVKGGGAGDEQQRLVGDGALGGHGDDLLGVGVVVELVPIELVVLLRLHAGLAPLPDGHHGVQRLLFLIRLVLRLVVGATLLPAGLGDLHSDGEADVVGILPHQLLEPPGLQELTVLLIIGVRLDVHDDVRAHGIPLAFGDGVAVGAGGLPHPGGVGAVLPRHHGDVVRHHKGGVEAHAELADDVGVLGVVPHLLLELVGAGGGDDAQVVLQVLLVHADAVVGDGQGPVFLVHLDLDLEVLAAHAHGVIRQG